MTTEDDDPEEEDEDDEEEIVIMDKTSLGKWSYIVMTLVTCHNKIIMTECAISG